MSTFHAAALVAVVAICTYLTRAFAFLVFGRRQTIPPAVRHLGDALPGAIIAILVVYCLKGIDLTAAPFGAPELLSAAVVVGLHLWKRNNLLSIGLGTVCYMALVQGVFC